MWSVNGHPRNRIVHHSRVHCAQTDGVDSSRLHTSSKNSELSLRLHGFLQRKDYPVTPLPGVDPVSADRSMWEFLFFFFFAVAGNVLLVLGRVHY